MRLSEGACVKSSPADQSSFIEWGGIETARRGCEAAAVTGRLRNDEKPYGIVSFNSVQTYMRVIEISNLANHKNLFETVLPTATTAYQAFPPSSPRLHLPSPRVSEWGIFKNGRCGSKEVDLQRSGTSHNYNGALTLRTRARPPCRQVRAFRNLVWRGPPRARTGALSVTLSQPRPIQSVFLTCQVVRFYSHVICPLYITKPEHGGKGAKPPIQEHSSLPA